eukprot:SAG11_NODE_2606_length_3176_cov_2.057524_5_plen_65_part_00
MSWSAARPHRPPAHRLHQLSASLPPYEKGYIRLALSAPPKRESSAGECGLTPFAAYPLGGSKPP